MWHTSERGAFWQVMFEQELGDCPGERVQNKFPAGSLTKSTSDLHAYSRMVCASDINLNFQLQIGVCMSFHPEPTVAK